MQIALSGITGRMGHMLVRALQESADHELSAGLVREGGESEAREGLARAGIDPSGITLTDNPQTLLEDADAVIDFSAPAVCTDLAARCAQAGTPFISGTTGLSGAQMDALKHAAKTCPVVWSPNMSIGVNLLLSLVQQAAEVLDAGYDIEIVEMHHRLKKDAPSGTALALGEAAARGRGVSLEAHGVFSRQGQTGERPEGAIGFAVLRGGDVVGDHTVCFAGAGERIELSHKASSRLIYAQGAIRAAQWAYGKKPGLYSMQDVVKG